MASEFHSSMNFAMRLVTGSTDEWIHPWDSLIRGSHVPCILHTNGGPILNPITIIINAGISRKKGRKHCRANMNKEDKAHSWTLGLCSFGVQSESDPRCEFYK